MESEIFIIFAELLLSSDLIFLSLKKQVTTKKSDWMLNFNQKLSLDGFRAHVVRFLFI